MSRPSTPPALWSHQQKALDLAKNAEYFAFFFDVGTGKTRTTIETLKHRYAEAGAILPTFIFCPPVVITNWKNELLKYSDISPDKIICLTGPGKKRLELMQNAPADSIFVTNYETLSVKFFLEEAKKKLSGIGVIVADELHKIKSYNTNRSKALHALAPWASYRYGLTGTPVLNSLEDLFSQFLFLDTGERFGKNYFSFRAKFFYDKNAGMPSHLHFPDWQVRPGSDKLMLSSISNCTMSAKKSECLDLPPLVKKTVFVELGPEQKKLYQQMKQDLIATIDANQEKRHSIAETALTKALRLQQIVSGHIRLAAQNGEEELTVSIKDNPRKEALKQLLESICLSEKVIVWSVFRDNYQDIREVCESLKLKYVELHGEVKQSDRDENIAQFNNNPDVRVLIGHPGSGGIGVNLIASSTAIFYSRSFSLEHDIQAEGRNYRGGSEQHEKITRIDLVAKDTIDEVVLSALNSKTELSEKVLRSKLASL